MCCAVLFLFCFLQHSYILLSWNVWLIISRFWVVKMKFSIQDCSEKPSQISEIIRHNFEIVSQNLQEISHYFETLSQILTYCFQKRTRRKKTGYFFTPLCLAGMVFHIIIICTEIIIICTIAMLFCVTVTWFTHYWPLI